MRKTEEWTATDGRDAGKRFLITEMSSAASERWARRALHCMGKSGVDIPPELLFAGMAAVAVIGLRALVAAPTVDVDALMDEMMDCVQIIEPALTRKPTEDDIEEPLTIVRLRDEVFKLHTGFSLAGVLSQASAFLMTTTEGLNTPTSAQPLEPS